MTNSAITLERKQIVEGDTTFDFHYANYRPPEGEELKDIVRAMYAAAAEVGVPVFSHYDGLGFSIEPRASVTEHAIESKADDVNRMLQLRRELELFSPFEMAVNFAAVEKDMIFRKEAKIRGDEGWALLQSIKTRDDEQVMRAISLMGDARDHEIFIASFGDMLFRLEKLGYPRLDRSLKEVWGKEEVRGPEHSRELADSAAAYVAGDVATRWLELYGTASTPVEPVRTPQVISNLPDALTS